MENKVGSFKNARSKLVLLNNLGYRYFPKEKEEIAYSLGLDYSLDLAIV